MKNRHAEEFFNAAREVSVKEEERKILSEDMENIAEDMMMKLRENKWQCKVCSKYADTKNDMIKHVEVHFKRTLNSFEANQ